MLHSAKITGNAESCAGQVLNANTLCLQNFCSNKASKESIQEVTHRFLRTSVGLDVARRRAAELSPCLLCCCRAPSTRMFAHPAPSCCWPCLHQKVFLAVLLACAPDVAVLAGCAQIWLFFEGTTCPQSIGLLSAEAAWHYGRLTQNTSCNVRWSAFWWFPAAYCGAAVVYCEIPSVTS